MQPESAANELVETLTAYRLSGAYSEFELQRLRKQIDPITAQRPVEGYMLLGMLACLAEDVSAVRKNHEASLNASPGDALLLANYSKSIGSLGFRRESKDLQERAYKVNPADGDMVADYASALLRVGRLQELNRFMEAHDKENLQSHGLQVESVEQMIQAASSQDVSDDDFEEAISLINEVMQCQGYYLHDVTLSVLGFGADAWLSYTVTPLKAQSYDELYRLNEALIDAQVERQLPAFEASLIVGRFSLRGDAAQEGATE